MKIKKLVVGGVVTHQPTATKKDPKKFLNRKLKQPLISFEIEIDPEMEVRLRECYRDENGVFYLCTAACIGENPISLTSTLRNLTEWMPGYRMPKTLIYAGTSEPESKMSLPTK